MRSMGRRKSDRWRLAAGMALGAVLLGYALYTTSCGSVSGPTPVEKPTTQTATADTPAPAPSPTATPSLEDPNTPVGNGRECSVSGATLTLKNTDPINHSYFGWSTDFDQATTNKGVPSVIKPGDTYDYTDPVGHCRQLDIAHEYNGIALCFAFLDKNGASFNPSSSPERVAECRTTPCVEEWREQEERVVEYGEYGDCKRGDTQEGCYRSRKVTTIIYESNSCTRAKREKSRTITYGTTPCECECVETKTPAEIPGAVYWTPGILQNQCSKEVLPLPVADTVAAVLNCHEVGQQQITIDYLCQQDGTTTRDLCRNVECPCVNVPTTRTADDWGPWSNPNSSCGHRNGTRTTYTLNSCTQQEAKESAPISEDKDCPFCHVAADGSPDNSNDFGPVSADKIKMQQFSFPYPAGNPGHNNHLNPSNFCPQDFWGTCSSSFARSEVLGIVCTQTDKKTGECKQYAYTCVPD